jgi:hypothetical protein
VERISEEEKTEIKLQMLTNLMPTAVGIGLVQWQCTSLMFQNRDISTISLQKGFRKLVNIK